LTDPEKTGNDTLKIYSQEKPVPSFEETENRGERV